MNRLLKFTLLLAIVLVGGEVCGQKKELRELENSVKSVIEKAYAASVKITQYDTILKQKLPSYFSGVVVNKAGHILTAAHAVQPGKNYIVTFSDGREVKAVTLGRMAFYNAGRKHDLAMLNITESGNWPVAQLGWSSSLKVNELCISISFPGNLNQSLPSIRLGRIVEVSNNEGLIQSTCKMEPGDSGGPLFDYMGRIIGIHNGCSVDESQNFENPVDLFRKYWSSLLKKEDYKDLPVNSDNIGEDTLANTIQSLPYLENINFYLPDASAALSGSCVKIVSKINGKQQNIAGSVIKTNSKTFIVSKSSVIGDNPQIVLQDVNLSLEIIERDAVNDLIIMQLPGKMKNGIPVDSIMKPLDLLKKEDLGEFLVTYLPTGRKLGIISSQYLTLPRLFSSGYLGIRTEFADNNLVIKEVGLKSVANLNDLKVNDRVILINGKKIGQYKDFNDELFKTSPGDTMKIEYARGDSLFSKKMVLTSWPLGWHAAEHFVGSRSERADDFKKVFAYDANIRSDQCGSPVFDLDGKFIGVNIARFSRTTVLVLPSEFIRDLVVKHM